MLLPCPGYGVQDGQRICAEALDREKSARRSTRQLTQELPESVEARASVSLLLDSSVQTRHSTRWLPSRNVQRREHVHVCGFTAWSVDDDRLFNREFPMVSVLLRPPLGGVFLNAASARLLLGGSVVFSRSLCMQSLQQDLVRPNFH
jgi:hypothetical protein